MGAPPKQRHLAPVQSPDPAASPMAPAVEEARDGQLRPFIARAREGDQQAWGTIYQRCFDGLYRHIGYLVHDPSVAEDLTQECFARAFVKLPSFDERSTFTTWLHGIGVNLARNHWRSDTRRTRAHTRLAARSSAVQPSTGDPELSHASKQRALALLAVLEELPPKLREAYVLLDLRQLPREEAAAQLGVTPGTLSVRASRARTRVRDELVSLGWVTPASTDERSS